MATTVHIRQIRADEALVLRALRLRALADSPMAFGSTLAGEQARPETDWHERAASGAAGDDRITFVMELAGVPAGMATGIPADSDPADVALVGLWVDPEARGHGAGAALVQAVISWARARGSRRVELWVTKGNAPAIALYERLGFYPTGETQPLPHTPSLAEICMVHDLTVE